MPNDYNQARQARKDINPLKRSPVLPPSKGESVEPGFLLGHENRFDPNVVTPQQLMQGEKQLGGREAIKIA